MKMIRNHKNLIPCDSAIQLTPGFVTHTNPTDSIQQAGGSNQQELIHI